MNADLPLPDAGAMRRRYLCLGLERAEAAAADIAAVVARLTLDGERVRQFFASPFCILLYRAQAPAAVASRDIAGAAIKARLLGAAGPDGRAHVALGEACGFRFEGLVERVSNGATVTPWIVSTSRDVAGEHSYAGYDHEFLCDESSDPEVVIAAFEGVLRGIAADLAPWEASLNAARGEAARLKRQLARALARTRTAPPSLRLRDAGVPLAAGPKAAEEAR